mgnify:CR=1 FL=1
MGSLSSKSGSSFGVTTALIEADCPDATFTDVDAVASAALPVVTLTVAFKSYTRKNPKTEIPKN